jgi:hypothetical protein
MVEGEAVKKAKLPQIGDKKQHSFAVMFYNIMHSIGKKMQNFKNFRNTNRVRYPLDFSYRSGYRLYGGKTFFRKSANRQRSFNLCIFI